MSQSNFPTSTALEQALQELTAGGYDDEAPAHIQAATLQDKPGQLRQRRVPIDVSKALAFTGAYREYIAALQAAANEPTPELQQVSTLYALQALAIAIVSSTPEALQLSDFRGVVNIGVANEGLLEMAAVLYYAQ